MSAVSIALPRLFPHRHQPLSVPDLGRGHNARLLIHSRANLWASAICAGVMRLISGLILIQPPMHSCVDGFAQTAPVGTFQPNGFELFDMLGNVWERVEDCWNKSYKNAPVDGTAWTKGECDYRIMRGGGFESYRGYARAAARLGDGPDSRNQGTGFRVARSIRLLPTRASQEQAEKRYDSNAPPMMAVTLGEPVLMISPMAWICSSLNMAQVMLWCTDGG